MIQLGIINIFFTLNRFPKDPERQRSWLHALRRVDFKPTASSVLCGDHFDKACFDRTGQRTRLKEGSIPTVFDFPGHLQKVS